MFQTSLPVSLHALEAKNIKNTNGVRDACLLKECVWRELRKWGEFIKQRHANTTIHMLASEVVMNEFMLLTIQLNSRAYNA